MESQAANQQIPEQNLAQFQSPQDSIVKKGCIPILLGMVFVMILVAVSAYYLGAMRSNIINLSSSTISPTTTQADSAMQTPELRSDDNLGLTTWSFSEVGDDLYLKQTISFYNDKVMYPNKEERVITIAFTQDDQSYNPQEVELFDEMEHSWEDILMEPIKDYSGSASILVYDKLFSFKRAKKTNSFIFVVELARSVRNEADDHWRSYQGERVIYLYNQTSKDLKKIATFPNNSTNYVYPKIRHFSQDGRYVYVNLFGCWNCGGHAPETFLIDLVTFKTLNIGKTSYFEFRQDGDYEYKDYVSIECDEPQPGECLQDPNSLPLKTGKI
jgi:hypothetical protein